MKYLRTYDGYEFILPPWTVRPDRDLAVADVDAATIVQAAERNNVRLEAFDFPREPDNDTPLTPSLVARAESAASVAEAARAAIAGVVATTDGVMTTVLDNAASEFAKKLAKRYGISLLHYAHLVVTTSEGEDWTAAIEAAEVAASTGLGRRVINVPDGTYRATRIAHRYGVRLIGTGVGGFGPEGETYGARLVQIPGTVGNFITFKTGGPGAGGITRTGATEIAHLEITGYYADGNCGLSARNSDNGTPVMVIDLARFHHLSFRNFGSHQMEFPGGGLPLDVHHIHGLYGGGALIYYSPGILGGVTEMVSFDLISGDGNMAGLIVIDGQNGMGPVPITRIKSERRFNPNSGQVGQDSAIVYINCQGLTTKIDGLSHQTSVDTNGVREQPGPAVRVKGNGTPRLEWSNVLERVENGATGGGTPGVFFDENTGYLAPASRKSGTVGGGESVVHVDMPGWFNGALTKVRRVIGWHTARGDAGIADPGLYLDGPNPAITLYESDAPADRKAWLFSAGGGGFLGRTVSDVGGILSTFVSVNRGSDGHVISVDFPRGISIGAGGSKLAQVRELTATHDFPSVANGGTSSVDVAVPAGVAASTHDQCAVSLGAVELPAGVFLVAGIRSDGTGGQLARVTLVNLSGAAYDAVSGTVRVRVFRS